MHDRPAIFATFASLATGASWVAEVNACLTLLIGVLTLAWWVRRWWTNPNVEKPPKVTPKPPLVIIGLALVLGLAAGCARFSTTQKDYSYESGKLVRKIYTKAAASTFFEAKSDLANWKASQTDKTQGASVGRLSQEATATNLAPVVEAIATGVAKGLKAVP